MFLKLFLFVILPLLSSSLSQAQSHLSFRTGINTVSEQLLDKTPHRGWSIATAYEKHRTKRNISSTGFEFGFSKLKTKFEAIRQSMNVYANGHYRYLFGLRKSERLTYFAGPSMNAGYNVFYFPNWDESHLYWTNTFGLSIDNWLSIDTGHGSSFRTRLSLPVGYFVSRPIPSRQAKFDDFSFYGLLESMHSNFNTRGPGRYGIWELSADYKYSSRFTLTYVFRACVSNDFYQLQHSFGIELDLSQ